MTDAEQVVLAAEDRRYAAVLEGDVDVLQELIHPAFLMVHSSGFADSKDSYIGNLRTGKLEYRRIDRSEQVVTVQDGTATVFNRLSMSVTLAGKSREVEARTLSVWVRSGDAWQMLAINSGAAVPKAA